jgi:hypothetical protein
VQRLPLRHEFSVAQARHPDTCGKCHLGPDHPQKEIYEESKHGIAFFANMDEMNLDNPKWVVGEDYWAAPTCATCHMSATRKQPVTHDVGPAHQLEQPPGGLDPPRGLADAKMGLPGANIPWQVRRKNMQDVCINCHDGAVGQELLRAVRRVHRAVQHQVRQSRARRSTSSPSRSEPGAVHQRRLDFTGTSCGTTRAGAPATARR